MRQVFISYSTKDAETARTVCRSLEQAGISCWIAPRDIPAGADYADAIPKAIRSSPVFVVLVSDNAMQSPHVRNEIDLATKNRRKIIPCRLSDMPLSDSFEYLLGTKQWVNLFNDNALTSLESNIRDYLLEQQRKAPKANAAPKPPQTEERNFASDMSVIWGVIIGCCVALGLLIWGISALISSGILGTIFNWIVIIAVGLGVIYLGFLLIIFLINYSDSHDPIKALEETFSQVKKEYDES